MLPILSSLRRYVVNTLEKTHRACPKRWVAPSTMISRKDFLESLGVGDHGLQVLQAGDVPAVVLSIACEDGGDSVIGVGRWWRG